MNKTLVYCDKKLSNTSRCSKLAQFSCNSFTSNGNEQKHHRCFEHKLTATSNSKVDPQTLSEFNQRENIIEVQSYLQQFIGKEVFSRHHKNKRPYTGVYLKNNGAIMCKDNRDKWYLVYYHQIINNEY
jgi:hypothetical protein